MKFQEHIVEPTYTVELSLEDLKFLYCAYMNTGTDTYAYFLQKHFNEVDLTPSVQTRRNAFERRMAPLWRRIIEVGSKIKHINNEK
jgi:hypothetical protein